MASFRSNGILLALVLVVAAVTACNHYTTQAHCQMYLEGNEYNINEMARNKMLADERIRTNMLMRVVAEQHDEIGQLRETVSKLIIQLLPQECPAEKSVLKDKET
jgi:hypothetical protein